MDRSFRAAEQRLNAAQLIEAVYDILVEMGAEFLDADFCEFLLEDNGELRVVTSTADQPSEPTRSYSIFRGIPGQAYQTDTPCVIDDLHDTRGGTVQSTGTAADISEYRSLCCVPVAMDGLLVARAQAPGAFTTEDRKQVEALAELASDAIAHLRDQPKPTFTNGGTEAESEYRERLTSIADLLSHDLKNRLHVIKGSVELASGSDEGEEHLERALASIERIEELTDEIVILARTGDIVDEIESIELQEAAEMAWGNVETQDAALEIVDSTPLSASRQGLCHLLENLIENAATHGGSEVTVRIGSFDGGFFVEDDGSGIPTEDRDRIFERGYSDSQGNSGLGLHIVHQLAEVLNWTIRVTDSDVGGARFEFIDADADQ